MYSYNWSSIDGSVFMHDIPFLYLDEERLTAGYLMKHIQLNDGKHKPVLRTLMELGMYDILLPALDLVERQMDHDNFCVSISCISKMPEYAELMSLLDDYSKKINQQIELSEMIRGKKLDMDSLIKNLHCSHVYNFVCEHLMSCADMILQSSNRCIGIVLFLLKNQGLNSHIAELFYKYALPASVRLVKDIMAKKIDDELIIAILRQRMCRYIVEYKQCLSKICDTLDDALYDISPENTMELTYGNFTEMIKKHSRSSCVTMLSITQQDMEVLSEFLDLSKIFLMTQKDISSYLTTIEENLPFLYHIVDLPDKANGILRKMIEKSSGEYNPALILPMARTLYLQPDSADSKMMKKTLQRIIEATLACKALSDWINDCVKYFTIFLDRNLREISRLAECKKMEEQLLSTVGINRNLDDEYRHIDLIYEWLSQNTIIRKFISVRDLLDTRDMPVLSCGVEIEEVINLFYSITSHFDSSPRIIIRTCAKSLHHELSEYDDYEFSYPAAEIDVKTVEELTNRLQRILKNFPSTKYANNINKIIDKHTLILIILDTSLSQCT